MENHKSGLGLFVLFLIAGCSSNSSPTCTDQTVMDLVLEISNEALFKQLLPAQLQANYPIIIEEAKDTAVSIEYEKIDPQGTGFVWGTMPVESFLTFVNISPTAASIKDNIDLEIRKIDVVLDAIRIHGEDNDIKKVSCESNLVFANGNTLPIQYSAQLTEDQQIWVEVFGL